VKILGYGTVYCCMWFAAFWRKLLPPFVGGCKDRDTMWCSNLDHDLKYLCLNSGKRNLPHSAQGTCALVICAWDTSGRAVMSENWWEKVMDRHRRCYAHLTIFMELGPSWEATSRSTTRELPTFYGTRMFVTMFTRALHCSLSWARWIHSIPYHPILYLNFNTLQMGCLN
jgi:hypothetical protein